MQHASFFKSFIQRIIQALGYRITKIDRDEFPVEATDNDRRIRESVRPYTMTSDKRLWSLLSATRYVIKKGVEGDFVECGVWRGGSVMAMASQLLAFEVRNRRIWLFDTFAGMTDPTAEDVLTETGAQAQQLLTSAPKIASDNIWCLASKEDVSRNIFSTQYPENLFTFIEGDILETLDREVPDKIALLRLDTDWYESTKKELEVLFPRLVSGGVCIIDDYGHWAGARKAVDEYLAKHDLTVLMHYSDHTGRLFIKI